MTGITLEPVVLELLASRICHDLISPVGAVNNGVEFLEEMGAGNNADAVKLIAFSAHQAASKLQAFRMVYGAGGRDPNIKPEDVQRTFSGLISADGKVKQSWDPFGPLGPSPLPVGFCKVLMGMLMLCQECLPKGGTVFVNPGENGETIFIAEGTDATVRDGVEKALARTINVTSLDPRLVHPYVISALATYYGFTIQITSQQPGKIIFMTAYARPV